MLLNKNNFCYVVHHNFENNENSKTRSHLVNSIKTYLNNYAKELKTETVYFKDAQTITKYFLKKQNINICWYGHIYESQPEVPGWKFGDIGLIVSNFLAWDSFSNSEFDYCLLMEDDLILEYDFFESLNFYVNNLPEDWELFSIYRHEYELSQYLELHSIDNDLISKPYAIRSNACYLINKKFAQKMIASTKIDKPLDLFLLNNTEIISYSLKPKISSKCFVAPIVSTYQHQGIYSRDFFKMQCNHLH